MLFGLSVCVSLYIVIMSNMNYLLVVVAEVYMSLVPAKCFEKFDLFFFA